MTRSIRLGEHIDANLVLNAVGIGLGLTFAAFVMAKGIPALRQDWQWPSTAVQAHRFLIDSWSTWSSNGIGDPAPYPSSYLIAVPLWVLLCTIGPLLTLYVLNVLTAVVVASGARALMMRADAPPLATAGMMAFAVFNPWVYTKTVAGHIIMILAYGATMHLVAFLLQNQFSWKRAAAVLVLAFAQLQFFVICMALLLFRWRTASARVAFLFGIIIFLPTLAGVLGNWHELSTIPYTLEWQQTQSVLPRDALMLDGYFARYTDAIALPAHTAAITALGLAALGLGRWWKRHSPDRVPAAIVAFVMLAIAIFASGTKGILAAPYAYLVLHFPPTGLFRELYDLLAYVAVGYIALSAYAARLRFAGMAFALCGLSALCCWFVHPPANFFVSRAEIAPIQIDAPGNSRFALLPAFQPMSFNGRGSGADPDDYRRGENVSPLNTYTVEYPGASAIETYRRTGSTRALGGASVAVVADRPWLRSDVVSLKAQLDGAFENSRPATRGTAPRHVAFIPELSLISMPHVSAIDTDLGDGNVFFGDASEIAQHLPRFHNVDALRADVDSSKQWVDARLTFLAYPAAAQGLGGAATSSRTAVLRLSNAGALLVWVRGELLDLNGHRMASNTAGYRWVRTSSKNAAVRCSGFCVIAGSSETLPTLQSSPPPTSYRGIPFDSKLTFLAVAELPPNLAGGLRYNVRFNRWWWAYADGRRLTHIRLDQTVNGWIINGSSTSRSLVVLNVLSALQLLLELIGAATVLYVLAAAAKKRKSTS